MNNPSPACIVCGSSTTRVRHLPAAAMVAQLEEHMQARAPGAAIVDTDYELQRCGSCSLEFSHPMQPGSSEFYRWITALPNYYPTTRWEWEVIGDLLQARAVASLACLEIGCGSGSFLEFMRARLGISVTGVDATRESAAKAAAKGFTVFNGELSAYQHHHPDQRFDAVFMFHCLEHVSDPVQVLTDAARILKDSGSLFISVPLSPSDYESRWFDPLNHPPHHLTRWSPRSFEALASRLGLSVTLYSEPPQHLLRRALQARQMQMFGSHVPTRAQRRAIPLTAPVEFFKELRVQQRRLRLGDRAAGNILLAEFRPQRS